MEKEFYNLIKSCFEEIKKSGVNEMAKTYILSKNIDDLCFIFNIRREDVTQKEDLLKYLDDRKIDYFSKKFIRDSERTLDFYRPIED